MIVKKINDLALDIQKTPSKYWLNIMKKNRDATTYYVIAGFDYDSEYNCYQLNSILDRLDDIVLDWYDFGVLVRYGYDLLNKEKLEDAYYRIERELIS